MYKKIIENLRRRSSGRNVRNALVSGCGAFVNPVLQLFATPYIYHKLGASGFGVWALITSVIAASGVASLGLGEAATKFVAIYRARADRSGVVRVVRSVWTLYAGIGILAALVIAAASTWLASAIFKVASADVAAASMALRVAAVGVVLRFFYGIAESTVRGYERYDVEALWATVNAVLTTVFALTTVYSGGGLVWLVSSGVVATLISAIGLSRVASKCLESWSWLRPKFDRPSMAEVFSFGVFSWIQNINGLLLQQFDRLIIGAWLGPAAAGKYSACLQLVQTAHGILSRACGFIFPLAAKLRESGDQVGLRRLFSKGMTFASIIGWGISGVFVVFGGEFLQLWMGKEFAKEATLVLALLAAWNAFMATGVVPFLFCNALGKERVNTILGCASTGMFVAVASVTVRLFGPLGAAYSRLSTLLVSIFLRRLTVKALTGHARWYSGAITLLPIAAAVGVGIWSLVIPPLPLWESFSIKAALYLLGLAACWATCQLVYGKLLWAGVDNRSESREVPYGTAIVRTQ